MKRKDSHFLNFFAQRGVKGRQTLTSLPEGWIVDYHVLDTPDPVWETVCGRHVPSLVPSARWVYWIPRAAHHTLLIFLNKRNEPEWFYADVIASSGLDEMGQPWTDDLYLDVVALGNVLPDGSWHVTETEIIDQHELDDALTAGKVTPEQYNLAWREAREVEKALQDNAFNPVRVIQAYVREHP